MNETEFAALSGEIFSRIEQCLEDCHADLDFELAAGGILEIEFADGGKIVINRHVVSREIWVAAKTGGFHFRYAGGVWRDTRDDEELLTKLSRLVSAQAGEAVSFA